MYSSSLSDAILFDLCIQTVWIRCHYLVQFMCFWIAFHSRFILYFRFVYFYSCSAKSSLEKLGKSKDFKKHIWSRPFILSKSLLIDRSHCREWSAGKPPDERKRQWFRDQQRVWATLHITTADWRCTCSVGICVQMDGSLPKHGVHLHRARWQKSLCFPPGPRQIMLVLEGIHDEYFEWSRTPLSFTRDSVTYLSQKKNVFFIMLGGRSWFQIQTLNMEENRRLMSDQRAASGQVWGLSCTVKVNRESQKQVQPATNPSVHDAPQISRNIRTICLWHGWIVVFHTHRHFIFLQWLIWAHFCQHSSSFKTLLIYILIKG